MPHLPTAWNAAVRTGGVEAMSGFASGPVGKALVDQGMSRKRESAWPGVRHNEAMSRLPDRVEPHHPVQDYDLCIGVLRGPASTKPVGHVLVESVVHWRRLGGVGWWKRWGGPEQTAAADGNSR